MNIKTISIDGLYYDGVSPVAIPAKLSVAESVAELSFGDMSHRYNTNELVVSPRIGHADRFIKLTDGGQYHCKDQAFLDQLPQEFRSEGLVAWLEKNFIVAIASIAIVVAIMLLGYFYLLPAFSQKIVDRVPITTEVSFGENVLDWFEENELFQPSEIEPEQNDLLTNEFIRLHSNLKMAPYLQLEFRSSDVIGPNAFALPGGIIVITDQMQELAESNEEILAILAHEAGHVEKRHSMRQILQSSLMALAIATVTSDATTVGTTLSGLPAVFLQSKYSREMEAEADNFAIALLRKHDISSESFASIMEKLDKESGGIGDFSFISTHPITSERIQKARDTNK